MERTSRRRLLATAGAALAGSLSGCILGGGNSGTGSAETETGDDLTTAESETVVSFDAGVNGWIHSVSHTPSEGVASVVGAIDVSHEQDYRVRLGIVDENGVVLADTVTTETLYDVGKSTVSAEFDDVRDCESCHSGLLQVTYPEGEDPTTPDEDEMGDGTTSNNDSDSDSSDDSTNTTTKTKDNDEGTELDSAVPGKGGGD